MPQMISNELIFFSCFLLFIALIIVMDLGVFNRKNSVVGFRQAAAWSFVWVMFAAAFYLVLDTRGELVHGITNMKELKQVVASHASHLQLTDNFENSLQIYRHNMSLEFITGYLVEYALSVDNIFVIILIFSSFQVREKFYKKILFWGILGAVILRCLFIFIGSALLAQFSWIMYLFGAFLAYSGIKLFFENDEEDSIEPENHPVLKLLSRFLPVFPKQVGHNFFIRHSGRLKATPLFVVLMVIEFTDLIFAVDSVPAVFAVTKDPYIVFFSNIFAILGLRSMFFFLANILHLFHFLNYGLALLLTFIGVKMLAHNWLHEIGFSNTHSLIIIVAILTTSIIASLLFPSRKSGAGQI
jgi:tellurite resistance protein TerC